MTRRLWTLMVLPLLIAASLALAACGGDDDGGGAKTGDPQELLRSAFSKPIKSGKLDASIKADLRGENLPPGPLSLKLSGPFADNEDKVPRLDLEATVGGGGISVMAGLVSTGDNMFVEFRGSTYEVGRELVARFNEQYANREEGESLKDFGVEPLGWISDPKVDGGEKVGGADTTKVTGTVDVNQLIDDFVKIGEQAAGQQAPDIPENDRERLNDAVREAKVDVYVSDDDGTLRRFTLELDLEIPQEARDEVEGFEGGKVTLDIQIADVGEDVSIDEPENARPLEELLGQFGLGGGFGGGGLAIPNQ